MSRGVPLSILPPDDRADPRRTVLLCAPLLQPDADTTIPLTVDAHWTTRQLIEHAALHLRLRHRRVHHPSKGADTSTDLAHAHTTSGIDGDGDSDSDGDGDDHAPSLSLLCAGVVLRSDASLSDYPQLFDRHITYAIIHTPVTATLTVVDTAAFARSRQRLYDIARADSPRFSLFLRCRDPATMLRVSVTRSTPIAWLRQLLVDHWREETRPVFVILQYGRLVSEGETCETLLGTSDSDSAVVIDILRLRQSAPTLSSDDATPYFNCAPRLVFRDTRYDCHALVQQIRATLQQSLTHQQWVEPWKRYFGAFREPSTASVTVAQLPLPSSSSSIPLSGSQLEWATFTFITVMKSLRNESASTSDRRDDNESHDADAEWNTLFPVLLPLIPSARFTLNDSTVYLCDALCEAFCLACHVFHFYPNQRIPRPQSPPPSVQWQFARGATPVLSRAASANAVSGGPASIPLVFAPEPGQTYSEGFVRRVLHCQLPDYQHAIERCLALVIDSTSSSTANHTNAPNDHHTGHYYFHHHRRSATPASSPVSDEDDVLFLPPNVDSPVSASAPTGRALSFAFSQFPLSGGKEPQLSINGNIVDSTSVGDFRRQRIPRKKRMNKQQTIPHTPPVTRLGTVLSLPWHLVTFLLFPLLLPLLTIKVGPEPFRLLFSTPRARITSSANTDEEFDLSQLSFSPPPSTGTSAAIVVVPVLIAIMYCHSLALPILYHFALGAGPSHVAVSFLEAYAPLALFIALLLSFLSPVRSLSQSLRHWLSEERSLCDRQQRQCFSEQVMGVDHAHKSAALTLMLAQSPIYWIKRDDGRRSILSRQVSATSLLAVSRSSSRSPSPSFTRQGSRVPVGWSGSGSGGWTPVTISEQPNTERANTAPTDTPMRAHMQIDAHPCPQSPPQSQSPSPSRSPTWISPSTPVSGESVFTPFFQSPPSSPWRVPNIVRTVSALLHSRHSSCMPPLSSPFSFLRLSASLERLVPLSMIALDHELHSREYRFHQWWRWHQDHGTAHTPQTQTIARHTLSALHAHAQYYPQPQTLFGFQCPAHYWIAYGLVVLVPPGFLLVGRMLICADPFSFNGAQWAGTVVSLSHLVLMPLLMLALLLTLHAITLRFRLLSTPIENLAQLLALPRNRNGFFAPLYFDLSIDNNAAVVRALHRRAMVGIYQSCWYWNGVRGMIAVLALLAAAVVCLFRLAPRARRERDTAPMMTLTCIALMIDMLILTLAGVVTLHWHRRARWTLRQSDTVIAPSPWLWLSATGGSSAELAVSSVRDPSRNFASVLLGSGWRGAHGIAMAHYCTDPCQ